MTCSNPQHGFRAANGGFTYARKMSPTGEALVVPCGHCKPCVASKVREWSLRIAHEASLHEVSIFATNTYRDECLPPHRSLRMRDVSDFMKRLRDRLAPNRIRYFGCGEYGPQTLRPHYHLCLFGCDLPDKVPHRRTQGGVMVYTSKILTDAWGFGNVEFGELTREGGSYAAGYTLKKLESPLPAGFYDDRTDPDTGEVYRLEKERLTMSTNPGIGSGWLDAFDADVFPADHVVLDGQKHPVPRFYRKRLKGRYSLPGSDPDAAFGLDDHGVLARRRRKFSRDRGAILEQRPYRLEAKEECLEHNIKVFKRGFEG